MGEITEGGFIMKLCGILTLGLVLGLTGSAWAVDGVVDINQARALAGGVSPGDTAGFPVTISQAGSYRLTGNLTVPDANTTAISVAADNVTIDLNGFSILGPTGAGTGRGVSGVGFSHTTVLHGTVQGVGEDGIRLGSDAHVEGVRAANNGGNGILTGSASLVRGNTAENNASFGLSLDTETGYAQNVLSDNNGGNANPQVSGGVEIGANTNICGGAALCP
jgi:hypothetical protein